jgi:exodeoxyribonuclease VII large subunit
MVRKLFPVGEGARAVAFKQLKEKLSAEGLFDKEHKRPLPEFAFRIGVITSQSGAAIRDIINVISRRAPYANILLRPAVVQGDAAPADIIEAIREMNEYAKLDVLIVGRGGGSEEDLWCFNDEGLARAIYNSAIPVISAVGHEVDCGFRRGFARADALRGGGNRRARYLRTRQLDSWRY